MANFFAGVGSGSGAFGAGLSSGQAKAAKRVYGFDLPTNYTTGQPVKTKPSAGISVPTFDLTQQTLLLPNDFSQKVGDGSGAFGGDAENDPNSMFSLLSKVKNPLLDSINTNLSGQIATNNAANNASMANIDALSGQANRSANLSQESGVIGNIFDPSGYAKDVNAIANRAKSANDITPFQAIINQYKPNLQNYAAEENRYLGSIYDPNGLKSSLGGLADEYKLALNRVAQQSANAARRSGNTAALVRGGGASSYLMAQDAANAAPIYANAAEKYADRRRGDLGYLNQMQMGALGRRGEADRMLRSDDTNLAELNRQFGIANAGIDQSALNQITGQRLGLLGRRNALVNDSIQGEALPINIRNAILSGSQQNLSAAAGIDNANRFYGLYKPDDNMVIPSNYGGGGGYRNNIQPYIPSRGGAGQISNVNSFENPGGSAPAANAYYSNPDPTFNWGTGSPMAGYQDYLSANPGGAGMEPADWYMSQRYAGQNYAPDQLDKYGLPLPLEGYE